MQSASIHIARSGEDDQIWFIAERRFGAISTLVGPPAALTGVLCSRSPQAYDKASKSGASPRFAFCSTIVNVESFTKRISLGNNVS